VHVFGEEERHLLTDAVMRLLLCAIRSIFKLKSASSKLFSGKSPLAKHLRLKSAYKTKVCMGTNDPVWLQVSTGACIIAV